MIKDCLDLKLKTEMFEKSLEQSKLVKYELEEKLSDIAKLNQSLVYENQELKIEKDVFIKKYESLVKEIEIVSTIAENTLKSCQELAEKKLKMENLIQELKQKIQTQKDLILELEKENSKVKKEKESSLNDLSLLKQELNQIGMKYQLSLDREEKTNLKNQQLEESTKEIHQLIFEFKEMMKKSHQETAYFKNEIKRLNDLLYQKENQIQKKDDEQKIEIDTIKEEIYQKEKESRE